MNAHVNIFAYSLHAILNWFQLLNINTYMLHACYLQEIVLFAYIFPWILKMAKRNSNVIHNSHKVYRLSQNRTNLCSN